MKTIPVLIKSSIHHPIAGYVCSQKETGLLITVQRRRDFSVCPMPSSVTYVLFYIHVIYIHIYRYINVGVYFDYFALP